MLCSLLAFRSLLYGVLTLWHPWVWLLLLHVLPYNSFLESLVGCVTRTFTRDIVDLLIIRWILRLWLLYKLILVEATLFFHQLVLVLEKWHIRGFAHNLWIGLWKQHLRAINLFARIYCIPRSTCIVLPVLLCCSLKLHLQSWRGSNHYTLKLFKNADT